MTATARVSTAPGFDRKTIPDSLRAELLANGEAFKRALETADAWERTNNRSKARPAKATN